MLRNILRTDARNNQKLLSWSMPPVAALSRSAIGAGLAGKIRHTTPMRATSFRALTIALALATMVTASLACFQEFSALMRQKGLRFLATPGNAHFIHYHGFSSATPEALRGKREPIGSDAVLARNGRTGNRFLCSSWSAKPYALPIGAIRLPRQTTRGTGGNGRNQLSNVTAAAPAPGIGTLHVFVARPSPNYDGTHRGSKSLLHLLRRAGFRVAWLDNQSGCKGVCDGIETCSPAPPRRRLSAAPAAAA